MARTTSARDYHTNQTHNGRADFTFADNGRAVLIAVVPAFSIVKAGGIVVSQAFNAGTTNVADIGTTADPDGLATDLALGTVGGIVADELATSDDLYVTVDTSFFVTPALTGTAATTGRGHAWIEFIPQHG